MNGPIVESRYCYSPVSPTGAPHTMQFKCTPRHRRNDAELCGLSRGKSPRRQTGAKNGLWQSKFDRAYCSDDMAVSLTRFAGTEDEAFSHFPVAIVRLMVINSIYVV